MGVERSTLESVRGGWKCFDRGDDGSRGQWRGQSRLLLYLKPTWSYENGKGRIYSVYISESLDWIRLTN